MQNIWNMYNSACWIQAKEVSLLRTIVKAIGLFIEEQGNMAQNLKPKPHFQ